MKFKTYKMIQGKKIIDLRIPKIPCNFCGSKFNYDFEIIFNHRFNEYLYVCPRCKNFLSFLKSFLKP